VTRSYRQVSNLGDMGAGSTKGTIKCLFSLGDMPQTGSVT